MAQTEHPKQQRQRRWPWIVGGTVLALLVIGQIAGGGEGDEYAARDVCEQFVSDRLVSPGSADFSRPAVNELAGSGTAYRVAGAVDADNRTGGSVRISYECKVRHTGGDEWSLIDLQTSER